MYLREVTQHSPNCLKLPNLREIDLSINDTPPCLQYYDVQTLEFSRSCAYKVHPPPPPLFVKV